MSKALIIINYMLTILSYIIVTILMTQTKEHLCCDGGEWWLSTQVLLAVIFLSNLAGLFIFLRSVR